MQCATCCCALLLACADDGTSRQPSTELGLAAVLHPLPSHETLTNALREHMGVQDFEVLFTSAHPPPTGVCGAYLVGVQTQARAVAVLVRHLGCGTCGGVRSDVLCLAMYDADHLDLLHVLLVQGPEEGTERENLECWLTRFSAARIDTPVSAPEADVCGVHTRYRSGVLAQLEAARLWVLERRDQLRSEGLVEGSAR